MSALCGWRHVCQSRRGRGHRGSRRRPRGTHEGARRAIQRRRPARLRPTTPRRCGSCAAALVTRRRSPFRWSAHAPAATAANGHGRGALCERRNGTASAQWAPRLPGQSASRLRLQALVRAAFDHFDPDRRGLWVRHADTHAQANTYRPRAHPGRMSAHAAAAVAQSCAGGAEVSVAPRRSFGLKSR